MSRKCVAIFVQNGVEFMDDGWSPNFSCVTRMQLDKKDAKKVQVILHDSRFRILQTHSFPMARASGITVAPNPECLDDLAVCFFDWFGSNEEPVSRDTWTTPSWENESSIFPLQNGHLRSLLSPSMKKQLLLDTPS